MILLRSVRKPYLPAGPTIGKIVDSHRQLPEDVRVSSRTAIPKDQTSTKGNIMRRFWHTQAARNCFLMTGLLTVLFSTASARADLESGPAKGEKAAALKVMAVTGDQENKELDYAAQRKDKPTIYVFIMADKWDRPVARYLKTLDEKLGKLGGESRVVAVWLTDDANQSKEYLPKAQKSLKLEQTALTVFPGDKAGPDGWGVNPDASLTAVVVQHGKVAASFGYRSVNDTVVPEVETALKKALDAK